MKKLVFYLPLIILLHWACTKSTENDKQGQVRGSDSVSLTVEKFLITANNSCLSNIEIAKLASKSNTLSIREFGEALRATNQQILDSVKVLARDKGITLSDTLNANTRKQIERLLKASGAEFDKHYLRRIGSEQRQLILEFRRNKDIADPSVKQFISNSMSKLRMGNEQIRELRNDMDDPEDKKQDEHPV